MFAAEYFRYKTIDSLKYKINSIEPYIIEAILNKIKENSKNGEVYFNFSFEKEHSYKLRDYVISYLELENFKVRPDDKALPKKISIIWG